MVANLTFTVTDSTQPTLSATAQLNLTLLAPPASPCFNMTIGQNLQIACSVNLVPAPTTATTVTITSANPATLLASAAPQQQGSSNGVASIIVPSRL